MIKYIFEIFMIEGRIMSKILTGMDKTGSFRVYIGITTDLVEEARKIHETTPLATAAMGRVLTGTGLMGLMMKNPSDKLTVIFKGDGPAKQILATADGEGNVKGYISNPNLGLPLKPDGHLDVGGAIGKGELMVIRDMGLKDPYVGKIALVSGEIAEDLTAYHYISEQQNTAVALGVKVGKDLKVLCSGGMIIQMLPDAKEEAVDALEKRLGEMESLTTMIEKVILNSKDLSETEQVRKLMDMVFQPMGDEFAVKVTGEKEMRWHCGCSKDRFEKALMTIGVKDMEEIIREDEKAELECQFCRNKYHFNKEELEEILSHMK